MHTTDSGGVGGGGWYLLALCVVILYQVLEEVHSFLGLNLIYFDQVLQSKERSRVQPGVDIQGVFKGFFGLMRYNVAEPLLRGGKKRLLLHYDNRIWAHIRFMKALMYEPRLP